MSEYLSVEGIGSNRQKALAHADIQAMTYFDLDLIKLDRTIFRGRAKVIPFSGPVKVFSLDVEYRVKGQL